MPRAESQGPQAPAEPLPPRPAYGHSKDGRDDLKQVLLSLGVSSDGGLPLRVGLRDGNTSDSTETPVAIEECLALGLEGMQNKVPHYFAQGRGPYGTRRIKYLLAKEGYVVSRRRIGRLLPQAGLRCKTRRKCKAPTAAGQAQTVAPNPLNRAFTVPKPDTVYVGDITYLPTGAGIDSHLPHEILCLYFCRFPRLRNFWFKEREAG